MADPTAGKLLPGTQDGTPRPSPSLNSVPSNTPATPALAPAPPYASTPTSSSTSRYIPQFSAATQMIVNRIKKSKSTSGPSTLPATSPQPVIKPEFSLSSYEDARKKVIMSMNTMGSTTMQMPLPRTTLQPLALRTQSMPSPSNNRAPTPSTSSTTLASIPPHPSPVAHQGNRVDARPKIAAAAKGMSAIRRVTLGLTASGRPIAPPTEPEPAPAVKAKDRKGKQVAAPIVVKRKPGRPPKVKPAEPKEKENLPDGSDLSDMETPASESATPTTTKSGRQILKPTTYNPSAMDSNGKKRQHSKVRTTEQALCKLCTRMASPDWNQIVFCDGCNDGWHQQCHTPWIPSDVIGDTSKTWFCINCQTKRDHQTTTKKQRVVSAPVVPTQVSWASHTPQQKRAYLSTLSHQELVGLMMTALEVHSDLPFFPGETRTSTPAKKPAAVAPVPVPAPVQNNQDDGEEEGELTTAWPKAGSGPFNAQLAVFMADNQDPQDDYRAVSHSVYQGLTKVWANGVAVA